MRPRTMTSQLSSTQKLDQFGIETTELVYDSAGSVPYQSLEQFSR